MNKGLKEIFDFDKKLLFFYVPLFLVLLLILFIVSSFDYALFHTIAELITIILAIVILCVLISVWTFIRNNTFISVVAISIVFVAFIDTVHIFTYDSMPYFRNYTNNLPAQLWVLARSIQSISLIVAIILDYKKIKVNYLTTVIAFTFITTLGFLLIFAGYFPTAYVPGDGLTMFKIIVEYIIMITFIVSTVLIYKLEIQKKSKYIKYIIWFTLFQVASEFSFTLFYNLVDISNFVGHYLKILASVIFTYIVLQTALDTPNMVLFEKLKQSEKKLKEIAYLDVLTDMPNRRKYEDDIKLLSKTEILPLTYIMADINGLKTINDSYGHQTGDELIKTVADSIKSDFSSDKYYRLGGDEFLVIVEGKTEENLQKKVHEFKKMLSTKRIKTIPISVSFGVYTKQDPSINMNDLYELSENSMYQNKVVEQDSRHGDNLKVILNSLFEKNKETEEHSRRVAELSNKFGKVLDLSETQLNELHLISLLHDIGKIGISNDILDKKGKLTNEEYAVIKTHPVIGNRIIGSIKSFEKIGTIILHHHEKYDGSGYPNGIKENQIPFFSHILSICDAFDAMTSKREYRETFTVEQACEELIRCKHTQFHPKLVDLFTNNISKIA